MLNKLLLFGSFFFSTLTFSQIIFSENFDANTNLPAGWVEYNVDNKTPYTSVSFMGTNAWIVKSSSVSGHGNQLVSTSYYNPPGQSNDWLVTPTISIPASGNYQLRFESMASNKNYPDGYEVYISSTGNNVTDFTNAIFTLAEASSSYEGQIVNLSAYAGQTINIAFRNNSDNMELLYLDNIEVGIYPNNDVVLNTVNLKRYNLINSVNSLEINVKNNGGNNINSLTVDWNDGTSHSSTIQNLTIAPGEKVTINHPTPISYATVEEKTIQVSITKVNDSYDVEPLNNMAVSKKFNTVSELVEKNVLFEEKTGTWCGYCPRGAVAMDQAYIDHKTGFIGIAVHNGDPMTVSAYNTGSNYGAGFPSANVDRSDNGISVSTSTIDYYFSKHIDLIPPASISSTNYFYSNTYTFKTKAIFKTKYIAANIRIAAIISEDNVKGTTAGYNQTNYYANNEYGPMGGYENLPDPVPASQMTYNHVGRALLGGYSGQINSVPTTIINGTTAEYTFNYTVPSTSNANEMYVTFLIIDQTNGEVLNAKKYKLSDAIANISENKTSIELNVYPNPTSENLTISFNALDKNYLIQIIDNSGKILVSNAYSNLNGNESITLPISELANGNYLISVSTDGVSYTQQFIKR